MIRSLVSVILTLALGAATVFFFYQYNFLVGILLLVWFTSRLFGYSLKKLAKGVGQVTTYSNLEAKCNCALEFKIVLEEVLKHPSVDRLFNLLHKKGIPIASTQKKDWIKAVLDSYRKKYGSENLEEVKFNIKNNLVWKNGTIDFNDSVYHEVFIPYEYKDGKEEENKPFLTPTIEIGITIRLFVVNGIVKLQIGDFSKEYSSKILSSMVYQTHDTITSFPLIYFSYLHKMPEKYLNLSAYATESWKNMYSDKKRKTKDFTSDWKELNKEVRDYNYVCSVADEYVSNKKRWDTIIAGFEKKKIALLEKENFRNPFASNDDDAYDDFQWNNLYYFNSYLSVFVVNHNDFREKRERYVYTDYYKERP